MDNTEAFAEGSDFLARITQGPVAVVMDGDADGLSAGRIVTYTLQQRKIEPKPIFPGKGQHAYSPEVVEQVLACKPAAVVLVDTGAAAQNPYAPLSVLVLDHHQPLGIPPGVSFVSSYQHTPPETSSLIAYLVCGRLVDLEPVEWLVLLGVFGDLGGADAFPELAPLVKRYTKNQVRKAITLLNAARRASGCDVAAAYQALCEAKTLREITSLKGRSARTLERCRKEVQVALDEVSRVAPQFADRLALLTCHSPCQVQGMLASRWARRLGGRAVLVVNTGFLQGKAVFSLRSFDGEDLIGLLRQRLGPGENLGGTIGYGHRSATGGVIPTERVPDLLRAMGFETQSSNEEA